MVVIVPIQTSPLGQQVRQKKTACLEHSDVGKVVIYEEVDKIL